MNAKSQALADILRKSNINARDVMVIGQNAHIDSYQKYHDKIIDLMTPAGFKVLRVTNGAHMDGTSGYRASFALA